ncbi:hypothetical protein BS50DRAFT_613348 [Corynespora cassiicola Philippines]|uniref:NAD(P)-binding protein n=1 Tax=Corynespora cassiicola Philippines TaxID=1448308 RepID=A0A2T2N8B1_CORCC|nr:hypothetical protein BS50DRAFT_613348 [Corynespora cassiicola Philippines]
MVNISDVCKSNSKIDSTSLPGVAVFVGGTAGIGKLTLGEMAQLGMGFKAYVVGRPQSRESFESFEKELQKGNQDAEIIWVEGQVSLLSEGIDVSHALEYYTRICFAENLLPLLRASGRARVISVHSGGLESQWGFNVNDLNLEKPGTFGAIATQRHMGIMNTLGLERLSEMKGNESIVFIHSHPGIVRTGNLFRGWGTGWWGPWFAAIFMDPILMLLAYSFKESAERYLYQVTSGAFGGKGPVVPGLVGVNTRGETSGGLFLASRTCETVKNEKELAKLRGIAQEAVWAKTREIVDPFL